MIRALVFDFDGLIVDSEGPVFQAWSEVYRRHGQELSEAFWVTIIGRSPTFFDPFAALENLVGHSLAREALQDERRLREREMVEVQPVLPGVREWHSEARRMGLKLGVASSSSAGWVTGHLERLGLLGWDCIRCREHVREAKPAPDLYLAAIDCLGVESHEALAIEDSSHGVAAAKAAGLFALAVPCRLTKAHDFSQADQVLGSLGEQSVVQVIGQLPKSGAANVIR